MCAGLAERYQDKASLTVGQLGENMTEQELSLVQQVVTPKEKTFRVRISIARSFLFKF